MTRKELYRYLYQSDSWETDNKKLFINGKKWIDIPYKNYFNVGFNDIYIRFKYADCRLIGNIIYHNLPGIPQEIKL